MISGTRRLNYTKRQKVRREDLVIVTRDGADGAWPWFEASLTLGSYDLPPTARVFVEAYRQTAYQRFDFGTVGLLRPAENRNLTAFGSTEADGVLFRVKVVEPSDGPADASRILAHADQVRPDSAGRQRSLLNLLPGEFRDEVWRLEIDEDTGPSLKVSKYLAPDRWGLVKSDEFRTLVGPEIFRRILTIAAASGKAFFDEDKDGWEGRWVRMACQVTGVPEPRDEPWGQDDQENWVEDAVQRFSRRHRIATSFGRWWSDGVRS